MPRVCAQGPGWMKIPSLGPRNALKTRMLHFTLSSDAPFGHEFCTELFDCSEGRGVLVSHPLQETLHEDST